MVLVLRAVPDTLPWALDTTLAVSTSRRSYKHRGRNNTLSSIKYSPSLEMMKIIITIIITI